MPGYYTSRQRVGMWQDPTMILSTKNTRQKARKDDIMTSRYAGRDAISREQLGARWRGWETTWQIGPTFTPTFRTYYSDSDEVHGPVSPVKLNMQVHSVILVFQLVNCIYSLELQFVKASTEYKHKHQVVFFKLFMDFIYALTKFSQNISEFCLKLPLEYR